MSGVSIDERIESAARAAWSRGERDGRMWSRLPAGTRTAWIDSVRAALLDLGMTVNDGAGYIGPREQHPAVIETQWCVFYGGPDPDSCAGLQVFDGDDDGASEADAREDQPWRVDSGVASRQVAYGSWRVQPLDRWSDGEPIERGVPA